MYVSNSMRRSEVIIYERRAYVSVIYVLALKVSKHSE